VSESLRDQPQAALGEGHVIERELGGGGMSHVFLAHERALGRQVVVKVLLPELAAGVNIERFRREIKLAAQLQHPHIVPLLSAGEAEGLPYFIMPYVTGESLRARLQREGELPVAETVRVLRDVVSALAYAHARGVVHRDVKPDNVLLSGGVAVVTDFGVAKAVSASAEHGGGSNITSFGVALGTPTYMSPEQASASPQADHRVDLYALGVMAYEMLTGAPPFTGRSPQAMLAAHVMEDVPPIERRRAAVPPGLATLVTECLAKSPADRPQTAVEVMYGLDAIATPSSGTAPTLVVPVGSSAPRGGPGRPGPLPAAVATAVAVALLLVAGVLLLRRHGSSPLAPIAESPVRAAAPTPALDSTPPAALAPSTAPVPPPAAATHPAPRSGKHPPVHAPAPRVDTTSTAADTPDSAPAPVAVAPAAPAPAPLPAPTVVSPAAPVPHPPPPPPDPRPEIGALVSRYATAVESGSVVNLKQVYPGMTAAQQQGWEQFFRLVRDVKAELAVGALDVTNSVGEAQVAGSYTYLNTSTQRTERQPVSFRATLRRDGGAWRIVQIR